MPTINRFMGAETAGFEEASSAGVAWSVSSANASILVNDLYHYRGVGTGSASFVGVNLLRYVALENTNLIVSFALEFTAWPATDSETVANVGTDIRISVSTGGTLTLLDSNNGSLDTFAASLNTLYEIEIYFQRANASGAWEWRINGTSQGSGTGADLQGSGTQPDLESFWFGVQDAAIIMDVNNIVVRSGCTTSDWLGTGISVCALATPAGTPTQGGDALSFGAMVNTQNIPLDAAEAQFNAGTARSRWIQSDADVWSRYYFDASDAGPTDNDAVWTGDANAFDGTTATVAIIGSADAGTETTNELRGEGTNAPAGATSAISSVRCRLFGDAGGVGDSLDALVYADGGTELLGSLINISIFGAYGSFTTLSAPTGGWTWAKVAALEVVAWKEGAVAGGTLSVIEVQVAHDYGHRTPTALGLTNTIACKLFMDS